MLAIYEIAVLTNYTIEAGVDKEEQTRIPPFNMQSHFKTVFYV